MILKKILVIQTAFIGDAILMTPLVEVLADQYPEAAIDILINKNNHSLFLNHPKIRQVWAWEKKSKKYKNLLSLIDKIRRQHYDLVVNCHRHVSSGLVTAFSGAHMTIGFNKNPMSFVYKKKVRHRMEEGVHEVDRNLSLVSAITQSEANIAQYRRPVLYPSREDYQKIQPYSEERYICIAPSSVWFTKQFPQEKWVELIRQIPFEGNIFLLGGPGDIQVCEKIREQTDHRVVNLSGKLSLLQSAALMQNAVLSYVNDSAPLHLASSVNAPVCAVYCSTVTDFGFFPLSDFSEVVEVQEKLGCRPCGLHGHKACPEGHFKCARDIKTKQLVDALKNAIQQY